MKPEVRVCGHLATAAPGPLPWQELVALAPSCVPYEGTDAIVRCGVCQQPALVEMIDRGGRERTVHIYRLAGLAARDVEAWLAHGGRGSCDSQRTARELESLVACAGPFTHLVACEPAGRRLIARLTLAADEPVLPGGWREGLPAAHDDTWFARLDLDKATGDERRS